MASPTQFELAVITQLTSLGTTLSELVEAIRSLESTISGKPTSEIVVVPSTSTNPASAITVGTDDSMRHLQRWHDMQGIGLDDITDLATAHLQAHAGDTTTAAGAPRHVHDATLPSNVVDQARSNARQR